MAAFVFVAVSPLVMVSIEYKSFADAVPAAAQGSGTQPAAAGAAAPVADASAVLAPAADIKKEPVYRTLQYKDISQNVQGFSVKMVPSEGGAHLKLTGMVPKECVPHLRFEIDQPNPDAGQNFYAVRVLRGDIADANDHSRIFAKADEDCKAEKVKACRSDNPACVDISNVPGVASFSGETLNQDGPIRLCARDYSLPTDHEDAVNCKASLKNLAGRELVFKTAETLEKEEKEKRKKEESELLTSTCQEAMKGDRDKIEDLRMLYGEKGAEAHQKLFDKLEANADNIEMEVLERRDADAESLLQLNGLVDDVAAFVKEHKKMKDRGVKLLLSIANHMIDPMLDADTTKNANKLTKEKMTLSLRAIHMARKLDPKNQDLYVKEKAGLLAKGKWEASTGDDSIYTDKDRQELANAADEVANRAAAGGGGSIASLAKDYSKMMMDRPMPIRVPTANGGSQTVGYMQGVGYTGFDDMYDKAVTAHYSRSIVDEYRSYNASRIMGIDGQGGIYSTAPSANGSGIGQSSQQYSNGYNGNFGAPASTGTSGYTGNGSRFSI